MQAKLEFPPQPLLRDGVLLEDEHGAPVMLASPVDRLTEEDWAAAGGTYRIPRSPSGAEVTVALFDKAMDIAQDAVYRLLALFTIPNRDLSAARKAGRLEDLLTDTVENLLDDAYVDELLELAASVGELIDGHLLRKARDLGPRLDPFLKLVGIDRPTTSSPTPAPASANDGSTPSTTMDGPSPSRPSSSTGSPASTPDGPPTSSSTPRTTSSSSSAGSSTWIDESSTAPRSSPQPIADRPQA